MSSLLTKTSRILKRNGVEYWLDKGTLLGVHRDDGLIPWEYDVDLGVMNATCAEISALKSEFEAVGLTAYDREDDIPHKVKLTYDTENHEFYWSDPRLHDPCIRVYDATDVGTWVDIYWYVELTHEEVVADRENVLVPPGYDEEDSLVCCSEGLQTHTEHMCCGGCVPRKSLFPLQHKAVNVHDGVDPVQEQPMPAEQLVVGVCADSRGCGAAGLEGCGLRVLDESAALYGASGAAQRRAGGAGSALPTPVLLGQRQAAETVARLLARDLGSFPNLPRGAQAIVDRPASDAARASAFFHTKPSSHDRKLVQEGFSRALFVPFHAKFWRQKPWFYETATALYVLHVAAVCIYIFHHKTTSAHNSFEVFFPIFLLFLVAIGYGRVSSALQAPDTEPSCKILSPMKQATENVCSSESETSHTTSGLGSGLAESENSDGTDSDEDSGNSSSSSDESNPNDDMFPHKSNSAPTSPKRVCLIDPCTDSLASLY
ncbi:unnamed protein product [Phytophthora lilii]|uniref:Unnamed protein product n=1 Tax=Phytophthora lilii TaxID=2077276 RepID=A0A9W6U262_9STRA|nr:unnamed protein product [Phytophthora lilii]